MQRGRHAGSNERRLPAARGSDHHQHANRGQPSQTRLDLAFAPEETIRVGDVVGHQAQVGADLRRFGQGRSGYQRGVLAKDRLLQRDQLRAGLDAQLADERRARLMQGAQRVTLPANLVLGQRQQRPPPLPQRGLGRPSLSLGEHLPMVTRTQSRLQADLLGLQAKLLEPASLDPTGVPALELAEGRPPPQRQRFTAHVRGTVVLAEASNSELRRASRSKRCAST